MKEGRNLGLRRTYADVAATIAEIFNVGPIHTGTSFLRELPLKVGV